MKMKMTVEVAKKLCKFKWQTREYKNQFNSIQLISIPLNSAKLEETRLAQKLRVKPNGVNIVGLAIGVKVTQEDLLTKVCPIFSAS